MPPFAANPHRFDPYKNFKFRVILEGRVVAGVSKVSGLKRTTEVIEHREGGSLSFPRLSPGRTKFEPVTLERGITHDGAFEEWARLAYDLGGGLGHEMSLKGFRKDLRIELMNEAGQVAIAYKLYRCWVSEYQALPELDANGGCVAIESIRLENEGWERDRDVSEPPEA
ncbi:MAG: phage tail protein [Microvirga sp.]|jgi:phage tail-like protein|nr:phage tail protein [Microvirga sp.]